MTDETTPKRVRKGQVADNPTVSGSAYVPTTTERSMLVMLVGAGWTTGSGADFSQSHPYQLVNEDEVDSLLKTGRFRQATGDEVKKYYGG